MLYLRKRFLKVKFKLHTYLLSLEKRSTFSEKDTFGDDDFFDRTLKTTRKIAKFHRSHYDMDKVENYSSLK